ncbi:MAG: S8 family serine peptidase [Nitrospira sp.]|nr:S8 family serine peptidase [Nitrospira sp.]
MRTKKAKGPTIHVKKKTQPAIPKVIYANASPFSVGGVSMFEVGNQISVETVANFLSEQEVVVRAVNRLRDAGFQVLQISPMTINIAGSQATYERAFNTRLVAEERPVIKPGGVRDTGTFIDCPETEMSGLIATTGSTMGDLIEGVAIEEPVYPMATSMFAPHKAYWHLDVPAGVSLGCNADKAHRSGITGKGIKVAMVDSGWFKHPFFVNRGYRAAPVVLGPGAANSLADESGHGTGESANIFACAPDVELLPVKINFVNSLGAFNAAVGLNPHIITCSWGSDTGTSTTLSAANQALAAAIAAAVAAGITVIFSAGNGHVGFPGQHPDVISAGGVFMDIDQSLRASNYASGFNSVIYPNRRVPDLSGLVGMKPGANYIMLPLEPGDQIDVQKAGGVFPNGDETTNNDGWAAFSGTSAAAPQLAGVAALIKQACKKLTPQQIKTIMMKTARDVTAGDCNTTALTPGGVASVVGPDASTGNGLVDAHKAVLSAKIQCLGPIVPIKPITVQPITPVGLIKPVQPIKPIQPITPIQPIKPIAPVVLLPPVATVKTAEESTPEQGQTTLSEEDVASLQDLIATSDFELDK